MQGSPWQPGMQYASAVLACPRRAPARGASSDQGNRVGSYCPAFDLTYNDTAMAEAPRQPGP